MAKVNSLLVSQYVYLLGCLVSECKDAQACVLLFDLRQKDLHFWLLVKDELIRSTVKQGHLQRIVTIVRASQSSTLAESRALIPGLISFD